MDFDSDEEFAANFAKHRIVLIEALRTLSSVDPSVTFKYAEFFVKESLSKVTSSSNGGQVGADSAPYLEFEAAAVFLDAILGKLSAEKLAPVTRASLDLLRMLLDCQRTRGGDPNLLSITMSCISSLFPAVVTPDGGQFLRPILDTVFKNVSFGDPNDDDKARMLRRHGCALMVKLATKYSKNLLPAFDHLTKTVCEMKVKAAITNSEYSTLIESLVLVSNEMKNYQMQSEFIKRVSEESLKDLLQMEKVIGDPASFIDFVGLNKPIPDDGAHSRNNPIIMNRAKLSYTTGYILSIVRRANYPDNPDEAQNGGFRVAMHNNNYIRNPAWEVAQMALKSFFILAKTLNGLWTTEVKSEFHPDYAKCLDILEAEKNAISGLGTREQNAQIKTKSGLSRTQTFLFELYENNYHFLSQLCTSCGYDFYRTPNLSNGIVQHIFGHLNSIPDFRLRAAVRMFLKSLVNKCPQNGYGEVLAPVLAAFVPYMQSRLRDRWKHLALIRESPGFDEDNADSQEVLDDVVCRHLTREYLDVVKAILTSGGGSDLAESNNKSFVLTLSELGKLVLSHQMLSQCVMETLLEAMLWPDSPSSVRASNLMEIVLPFVINIPNRISDADASQIYYGILSAFNKLGQHEANYITLLQLAIQAYEWMRPKYGSILTVMSQVPGCNPEDLKRFDDRIMASNGKENGQKSSDRSKKDMFKKLIASIIGKDLAQMFKNDIVIKNLPTLQTQSRKQKTPSLEETEKGDIGLGNLFASNGQL